MLAQKDHIIENAGDQVAGDKYIVEKINDGYAAIGRGARLIVKNAISYAEEKQELKQLEQAQLARSVAKLAQSLEGQAKPFAVRERNPYKNIDYYDISDAGRFYGRQEIRDQLLANLICSNSRCRLVVLHGEVGFGKTGLLRAGVMPLLVANGHLPLFVRVTTSSLTKSIMKSLFPEITETTDLKNASLQSFLRQVATILGPEKGIFILLDQFEHFFDASEEQRSEFLKELDDCLNDPTTGTSWLICVRSSRLGYLNVFQQIDRQPSTNSAVLGPLARNDARQAVNKPAQDAGFSVETELSEVLLDDLGGEIIEPVSLQIVCHTLVELLPDEEKKLTLQHYTKAGRAGGILRNYLDLILEHNLVEEDRDKGWKVLDAVDDLGPAKATIVRLESRLNASGMNNDECRRLLVVLEKSYLVRRMGTTYQLTNEKFSPRIRQWRAEQAAIEHVRQETIRQLKRVRDSALRGLVAGALGFSLAFLIIFANKIEETYLLGYITVLRTVPGGLAGLLLILCIDVGFCGYRYRRQGMTWIIGGLAGAISFAIAFGFHALLRSPREDMVLITLQGALQGGLWGAVCGVGIVWALRATDHLIYKTFIVIFTCGLVFWLADQLGGAFAHPNPPLTAIMAGAVLSLSLLATALLLRRRNVIATFT